VNSVTKLMTRIGVLTLLLSISVTLPAQEPGPANRVIGTVTSIKGNTITVKGDSGAETAVTVDDSTKILRTAPGQRDLKDATPIHLQDLQVGDRALVRGSAGPPLAASSIIVMKQGDVASRQQQEMQEWQRRGTGGIVRSVDPASGTISISAAPGQTITVTTSASTQFLRYAPDSIKFSDAKKSSLNEIKPGDQLRARGARTPDGEVTADAVISGSFRNIAGTVNSVDASAGTLAVMDLITKKPAIVKITPETQMRKIPPEVAQRIAMFLKRPGAGASGGDEAGSVQSAGAPSNRGPRPDGTSARGPGQAGVDERGAGGAGGPGGRRPGGGADFQQLLRQMPAATLTDFQKGDAVMIVTTAGAPGQEVTALTMLSGVEPILTAAPTQASANLLSGWSMSGGEGQNQ
jgi:hypothetical protein